ncbi:MAG TPA: urate oxidase [Jiangellaceae bacterium]|nr:urate oxidase [Jiangellaceae bacterium]
MNIVLGPNRYGKAETHLVRIYRETPRHRIRDLLVSTSLQGDFEAAHVSGDQSAVLPTDTQKNTVFAYAKAHGVGEIEDFALRLARHFVADVQSVTGSRIDVDEYEWERIDAGDRGHDHAFVRNGREVRTTTVTVEAGDQVVVVSGLKDLTVLKSTGSEFHGFLRDRYTTLADTTDRILATSLEARWRYLAADIDWSTAYSHVRALLLETFANTHSKALQHTLWGMGRGVLEARPDIAEIHLTAPNKHHFAVDLSPFGLDNPGEVFYAADRPYGLIEATVRRDHSRADAGRE